MSDINVIDPTNSFTGNLGPSASFLGSYINVEAYTSITVTAIANVPPAPSNAIQFEWSEDGINLDSTTTFGSDASTQQTAHGTVRAAFFRLRYTANTGGLTGARVQTLLRTGPFNGSVTRVGLITGSPDALVTNSVTMGKATTTYQAVKAFPDAVTPTDYLLGVDAPARRTTNFSITTAANLSSVQIDFAGLGAPTRRWAEALNNTERGNLYIRLGSAVTLVNYQWKVPPGHVWQLPITWPMYGGAGGTVFGIWDVADGECRWIEGA